MRFLCYSYYFISVFLCSAVAMLFCEESFSKELFVVRKKISPRALGHRHRLLFYCSTYY